MRACSILSIFFFFGCSFSSFANPALIASEDNSLFVPKFSDFRVSLAPSSTSEPSVLTKPSSVYKHPTFVAGVTTLALGGLMVATAGVMQALQGTPGGNCSLNGSPLSGNACVFDPRPAPTILFTVGGASLITGTGLLLYWGTNIK